MDAFENKILIYVNNSPLYFLKAVIIFATLIAILQLLHQDKGLQG